MAWINNRASTRTVVSTPPSGPCRIGTSDGPKEGPILVQFEKNPKFPNQSLNTP